MKVPALFVATLATSATAFPHLALQERSAVSDLVGGLVPVIQALTSGSFGKLNAALDAAVNEAAPYVNSPNVSMALAALGEHTPEKVYETFGLKRDRARTDAIVKQGKGGGYEWGNLAEDCEHPYKKPKKGDMRGPCPALNMLANHDYIPRSGVVTPGQLVKGIFQGLNVAPSVAKTLATVGFLFRGDMEALTLSIGGPSGKGAGINKHGVLEGDASLTRNDALTNNGDGYTLNRQRFDALINDVYTYGKGDVTAQVMAEARYRVWQDSKANNPNFDFNPLRMYTALGENAFVHEVFRGDNERLTPEMLESIFVRERFPTGWRRRYQALNSPEILAWQVTINRIKPVFPTGFFSSIGGLNTPELWQNAQALPGQVMCKVVGDFAKYLPEAIGTQLAPFLAGLTGGKC